MLTGNKDLDFEILNELNDKDLISFCSTSQEAKSLCNDQTFWQRRVIDRFGKYLDIKTMRIFKAERSWSDYYIELNSQLKSKHPAYYAYDAAKALEHGRKDIVELLKKTKGVDMELIKDPDVEYYQDKNDKNFIPKAQGRFKTFINGKLKTEGDLIDSQRFGKWFSYYNNGEIDTIQNYNIESKHDGEQFKYDENGELKIYEVWKNGELLKRDKF